MPFPHKLTRGDCSKGGRERGRRLKVGLIELPPRPSRPFPKPHALTQEERRLGGLSLAARRTPEERSEAARHAICQRWHDHLCQRDSIEHLEARLRMLRRNIVEMQDRDDDGRAVAALIGQMLEYERMIARSLRR